ncbi:helix-turn-helix domain-containing protein [Aquimarina agarilytica]|uniref:helix-turn-helix domain-containing protein n=1 Tax=Aquimarina agarilytica TaxID=1087449 RepID=UPI0002884E1E|nr:helix-turn-helix domain-containing protein [Aquimarina agarilytica]
MQQQKLLSLISNLLPEENSLAEQIASVLDISYGAAYRRINNKSKISIDEAITLAKHFNLSIDSLFGTGDENVIPIRKMQILKGTADFEKYFTNSTELLTPLLNIKNSEIIYSAKDLPIFYTSEGNMLTRFKLFVWLQILDPSFKLTQFSNFALPSSLKKSYQKFGLLYDNLNTVEIWDITTINSTLKQLHYYFESGIITSEETSILCDDLKKLIHRIYAKSVPNSNFKLYYNELLLMSNNVLIKTPLQNSLFVPFTVLNYFNTNDTKTCEQVSDFIAEQLKQSKLINTSGEKEKNIFFNKIFSKIDELKSHVNGKLILDF